MPNIKSAIKRVKVTEKKNLRNRMIKSAMRTSIKKFDTAISAGTADAKLLSATSGAVDKAAAKGVIHKNAANRKKARLAKHNNVTFFNNSARCCVFNCSYYYIAIKR